MFKFKALCFACEATISVSRISNNEDELLAYVEPHQCGKTFAFYRRIRLAIAILIGKPTGYFTDMEEEKDG